MDPAALTYNSGYTTHVSDDCEYPIYGCTDSTNDFYVSGANAHNASACAPVSIPGCIAENSFNFDSLATFMADPDPCIYIVTGCTDSVSLLFSQSCAILWRQSAGHSAGCQGAAHPCLKSLARPNGGAQKEGKGEKEG